MKWPFKRNQNVDSVPQEIQEYYQTERRERTGVAWLLALGTLLITVGLAVALFFGGRWAYRKIAGNDNQKSPETSQVAQTPTSETRDEGSNEDTAGNDDEGQTEGATSNDSQTSSTSTNQPNTSTQSGGRAQGATTSNLPNTGPSETLAVVAATVVVASAAHYAFSKEQ